jgi:acetyl esterase/lipase
LFCAFLYITIISHMKTVFAALLGLIVCASGVLAQSAASWSQDVGNDYWIAPDRVYGVENNYTNKLDVIYPHSATKDVPAVVYIHGGGWVFGDKAGAVFLTLPYLEMGWAAVNVEYRMASISKAPAAVEDCRCALRWIAQHAKEYHIDPERLVLTGHSAGGHLALITGMLSEPAGLDSNCAEERAPGTTKNPEAPRPAAIVNWYGITDVNDLLDGPNRKTYAVEWLGSQPDRDAVARRVSPLTYVRKELPPIISVHGDADDVVPYSHAVRLHHALDRAGVPNQLFTITHGGHGQFTDEQNRAAYEAIFKFLKTHGLGPVKSGNT